MRRLPSKLESLVKSKVYKCVFVIFLALSLGVSLHNNYVQLNDAKRREDFISTLRTNLMIDFNKLDKECFPSDYDKDNDDLCIKVLGNISRDIDAIPDNTEIEAEMWEIGRVFQSSKWISTVSPKLNDRLVYQFSEFYGYGISPTYLYGAPDADVRFRDMLRTSFRRLLVVLRNRYGTK